MWKHKKNFKGQQFLGNYEYNRSGKRFFVLKNDKTGREIKFVHYQQAQSFGWVKTK